jgi:hypothetical protein
MRVGLACSKASQISCVGALNCRNSVRQRDRDFYSTHFDTRAGHNANLSALDEENEWLFGLVLRLQQKEEKWTLNGSFKA